MASEAMKQAWKVPEPTLRRLPWYLAFVKLLKGRGEVVVSSTQIAKEINVDPSQVAKDLSFINITGKTRVGYEVDTLVAVLEDFLGFTSRHKAFLFGVGSLGASLLHDTGLRQYGLEIVAGFDVREEMRKCGISPDAMQRFIDTIVACEEAQYSPMASAQMSEVYAEGVNIISELESTIKKHRSE